MELLLWVVAAIIIGYAIYLIMTPPKKEESPKVEPVDTIPPLPILTRSGELVETGAGSVTEVQVESSPTAVTDQITDSVTQASPETKKENNMATKKAPAPKKEPAKKAPAKKPKK